MNPPPSLPRRGLLAAAAGSLLAPAFSRFARAADRPRFELGVASGHPLPGGFTLWTRLTGPDLPEAVPVQWEVAEDERFTRVLARGTHDAQATWGHSVHVDVRGLTPGRWYSYRFSALGQPSATGRTRTAPGADEAAGLRFALASCQRWDHGHYAAWRDAAAQDLDLVLFAGDYIYESARVAGTLREHAGTECVTLADYRARYAQYKGDPLLQAAHAAAPWVLVWDDHEVDNDYAGLVDAALSPTFAARRAAAYQAWWEHQPVPASWRPVNGALRLHGHLDWGRNVRLLCLDDRQYRDPQACQRPGQGGSSTVRRGDCAALHDPTRTLLGAQQEAWLQRDAWRTGAPWHLVLQQTLMSPMNWTDPARPADQPVWTDGWDGYPAARSRLLRSIAARDTACVVLGGDVHASYAADLHLDGTPDTAVVATEFCGTSISSHGMRQDRIDAVRPWNPHLHHARSQERGYLLSELSASHLTVAMRTVDDPADPGSAVRTQAHFAVSRQQPGVQAG